jgi:tryptophanyl-tRNA synthetase
MSKSYGNVIYLSDAPDQIQAKVMQMVTDPQRARRSDPGNPEVCNVYEFHKLYTEQKTVSQIDTQCRNAQIGCVDCKKLMATNLIQAMAPIYERRRYYHDRPERVTEIIEQGSHKAGQVAQETMREVRDVLKINY